jgi:hypothetical protein
MSEQETFDIVARHLLTQGCKSYGDYEYGLSMYRNLDGMKCAVGALIPDDMYDLGIEGLRADKPAISRILLKLGHNVALCRELQIIHDHFCTMEWHDKLRLLAEQHGLNTAVLESTKSKA